MRTKGISLNNFSRSCCSRPPRGYRSPSLGGDRRDPSQATLRAPSPPVPPSPAGRLVRGRPDGVSAGEPAATGPPPPRSNRGAGAASCNPASPGRRGRPSPAARRAGPATPPCPPAAAILVPRQRRAGVASAGRGSGGAPSFTPGFSAACLLGLFFFPRYRRVHAAAGEVLHCGTDKRRRCRRCRSPGGPTGGPGAGSAAPRGRASPRPQRRFASPPCQVLHHVEKPGRKYPKLSIRFLARVCVHLSCSSKALQFFSYSALPSYPLFT